jgi:hypothetical protein
MYGGPAGASPATEVMIPLPMQPIQNQQIFCAAEVLDGVCGREFALKETHNAFNPEFPD